MKTWFLHPWFLRGLARLTPSYPSIRSRAASFSTALLVVSGTMGLACSSTDNSSEFINAQSESITGPHGEECDRSPYNCRLPNELPNAAQRIVLENKGEGHQIGRNRALNTYDTSYFWQLKYAAELRDGSNGSLGWVAPSDNKLQAMLNFGARKNLGGVEHVYAWFVPFSKNPSGSPTESEKISGWIPVSSVYRQNTLAQMPSASPEDPGADFYETDWVVTGGDLSSDGQRPMFNDVYGDLRVNPNVDPAKVGEGAMAVHYLVRDWDSQKHRGYVNFLYNLPGMGGVSRDTFPLCVHFKRFKNVTHLETALYPPNSSIEASVSLNFVFGTIDGRRGWIARDMLTKAQDLAALHVQHPCKTSPSPSPGTPPSSDPSSVPPPEPAPSTPPPVLPVPSIACHALCCLSGPGAVDVTTADTAACFDAAQAKCNDWGHVQSITANGSSVYQRAGSTDNLRCWAKCKNRINYHEVVGVTQDCTSEAQAYCSISDRGGLQGKLWNRCDPN